MKKLILFLILCLYGCNPQLNNKLKDFNFIECADYCIIHETSFTLEQCLLKCDIRLELKEKNK